jgi:hypothetical protein
MKKRQFFSLGAFKDAYHQFAHFFLILLPRLIVFKLRSGFLIQRYILFGNFHGRALNLRHRANVRPLTPSPALPVGIQVFAFYLPQFHQIPENDKWWGQGFTEWVNVRKAKPLFPGHYQPRLPRNEFYDLSDINVMKEQAILAKDFGVDAFVVYYYWFNGKRLLEKPIDNLLANSNIKFPYILCWANENWTRRWDGRDQEILIEQTYLDDWVTLFYSDIGVYFNDLNYQRLGNKIILLVYRPDLIPNFFEFSKILKERVLADFSLELLIFGPQFSIQRSPTFSPHNLDGIYEFPPNDEVPFNSSHGFMSKNVWVNSLASRLVLEAPKDENLYPGVFTSWDNTARRGTSARIFHPNEPRVLREWIFRKLMHHSQKSNSTPSILFINAWNEWAEGAHLEPDRRFGFQWLWAVYDARKKFSEKWDEGNKNI